MNIKLFLFLIFIPFFVFSQEINIEGMSVEDIIKKRTSNMSKIKAYSTKMYPLTMSGEFDQIKEIIEQIQENPTSRRLIFSAWNPVDIPHMALPPCHMICQFHVRQNKYLSCAMLQRSGDIGLGIPFNVASYSLFTHILAKHCGLEADEFTHFIGNAHIYEQHIDALKNQITRKPLEFPKINIKAKYDKIEEYSINDIEWIKKYESDCSIKMEMIA